MGIDSPWVCEHPEWFVSLDHSPFPAYTFQRRGHSSDPRVAIYLEDHYYDRSDAAVVFKWVERSSGAVHYIYHGNDGTRMPWNDTAQLNYLRPEVREAVMQTILAVARKFPIIRFDAAMTLTRQALSAALVPAAGQRRRYPLAVRAGDGPGAIRPPHARRNSGARWSTAWRAEIPDTLLLAEAFWLMESYFVRTLGMHRVYNSAFMNFLKDGGERQVPPFAEERAGIQSRNPQALRQFHEQPRRRNGAGPVRQRRQVFRRLHPAGHPARFAHVRPWPDRGLRGKIRHGIPQGLP